MKKFSRSVFSALLAALLVIAMAIPAFAGEKQIYTCLGDSNAAGYNSTGWVANRVEAPNAYHSKVAKMLDMDLRPFGTGGFRTDEVLYMLDPDFQMDWSYADICNGQVHKADLDAYKEDYIQAVIDADVISIQVGANDLMGEDLGFAMMNAFYMPFPKFEAVKAKLADKGVLGKAALNMVTKVETMYKVYVFLDEIVPRVKKTYADFEKNWDAIVENIYRLNPDVTLVAVSTVNPWNNTTLTVGSKVKIGRLLDPVFNRMNNWVTKGSKYAGKYLFVDIRDIKSYDLAILQEDFMTAYLAAVHPTDDGHTEIANRIVAAVKAAEKK